MRVPRSRANAYRFVVNETQLWNSIIIPAESSAVRLFPAGLFEFHACARNTVPHQRSVHIKLQMRLVHAQFHAR
jgi:hypothetical protein